MTLGLNVLSRSWQVGSRTATLSVCRERAGGQFQATVEWSPSAPSRLIPAEWQQYRSGRNAAVAELAAELGISAAVLEV